MKAPRVAAISRRSILGGLAAAMAPPARADWTRAYIHQLRDRYHRDLFEDFLPFMDRFVGDHEYGGFLCDTDIDGSRADDFKSPLFEGRGIWVYSFLYTHFGRDPRHLETARKSFELLRKSLPGKDEFWSPKLHRDGTPAEPPGTALPPDLAVVEGAAAYALASQTQEPLDLAKRIFRKCIGAYDSPDYNPNIGRAFLGPSAPPLPGARNIGMWMLFLRCATQIRNLDSDPAWIAVVDRVVDAVVQHHFNPAFQLNNEILLHDLSRPPGDYAELVYTAHTFEISWMLLEEAVRRRDDKLFQAVADRFRRHVDVAWDPVYGGVYSNLRHVDENQWILNKLLWAQEEVLITALAVVEHSRSDAARELFSRMDAYVRSNFPLHTQGSPLWMYAADRRVSFESFRSMPKRVENYHHPRHLTINLLRLNAMLARR